MAFDDRISLQKLEVFCLVVELGGVTRAAHHLFVTQPVVTSHLRTLSEHVGAQLFVRQSNQLRLTDAGKTVYSWAKEVLTSATEVAREVEGVDDTDIGSAIICASMSVGSYLLPPILLSFLEIHPRAQLSLSIADPEIAVDAAERGACDFAIIMWDDGPVSSRALNALLLGYEPLALVTARFSTVPEFLTVADLSCLPFICSPKGHLRRRTIDRSLLEIGVHERRIAIELGHPEAMKIAVRQGVGVTFAFRCAVEDDINAGVIREVQIKGVRLTAGIYLVQRAAKRLNLLQESLVEFIRLRLADRLLLPGDELGADDFANRQGGASRVYASRHRSSARKGISLKS